MLGRTGVLTPIGELESVFVSGNKRKPCHITQPKILSMKKTSVLVTTLSFTRRREIIPEVIRVVPEKRMKLREFLLQFLIHVLYAISCSSS